MQKEIYIVKGLPEEGYGEFESRILQLAGNLKERCGPARMKVTLTTRRPPAWSVIPFRKERVSVFTLPAGSPGCTDLFRESDGFTGGYLVDTVVPVSYQKSWKDGDRTPGVCLLTLFHSRPGISRDIFIRRWFEGHTPLSLRLHPLWNYNRNEVKNVMAEGSVWYDGIVEEQFREAADLLNPLKFFGPPLSTPAHMLEVYRDSRSFIDMKRIETYLATEIHLAS